ncbi:MAG: redoxin domain-containing protein [Acidimicrobiia bacterium]|nr:redoxin domain-containing protein [Acidimicrobiia bacterium]MYB74013.1 redoxin domain-containing protein [Acidimicrobiia bacterium]MYH98730.1 redoxin domain-containing protein [Acidimicrobiia bacterium]
MALSATTADADGGTTTTTNSLRPSAECSFPGKWPLGSPPMLSEGTKAPEFTAPDQDGNDLSLADLRGNWVAFWWYPKASTKG